LLWDTSATLAPFAGDAINAATTRAHDTVVVDQTNFIMAFMEFFLFLSIESLFTVFRHSFESFKGIDDMVLASLHDECQQHMRSH
jgi:hypothetical protein